jgi:hypothetical protein
MKVAQAAWNAKPANTHVSPHKSHVKTVVLDNTAIPTWLTGLSVHHASKESIILPMDHHCAYPVFQHSTKTNEVLQAVKHVRSTHFLMTLSSRNVLDVLLENEQKKSQLRVKVVQLVNLALPVQNVL